jgi:hypothetical protein
MMKTNRYKRLTKDYQPDLPPGSYCPIIFWTRLFRTFYIYKEP